MSKTNIAELHEKLLEVASLATDTAGECFTTAQRHGAACSQEAVEAGASALEAAASAFRVLLYDVVSTEKEPANLKPMGPSGSESFLRAWGSILGSANADIDNILAVAQEAGCDAAEREILEILADATRARLP